MVVVCVVLVVSAITGYHLIYGVKDETGQQDVVDGWSVAGVQGDYDKNKNTLEGRLEEARDVEQQSLALIQLSVLAANNNQVQQALEFALQADKVHPTSETARLVGDMARLMDDNTRALGYYRLALERIGDPGEDEPKRYRVMEINDLIRQLEEGAQQ